MFARKHTHMKKAILFLFAASVLFSGCKKECGIGYEGSNCKTEVRTKFYGFYTGAVTQNNTAYNGYYEIAASGTDANKFEIGPFVATLQNNDGTFTIASQTVNLSGLAYTATGNGAVTGTQLNMLYNWERNGIVTQGYFTGVK